MIYLLCFPSLIYEFSARNSNVSLRCLIFPSIFLAQTFINNPQRKCSIKLTVSKLVEVSQERATFARYRNETAQKNRSNRPPLGELLALLLHVEQSTAKATKQAHRLSPAARNFTTTFVHPRAATVRFSLSLSLVSARFHATTNW